MKTISERIAEAVADMLLLREEYDPAENDPEYLEEAKKHLDMFCSAYRRIGAKINISRTTVTVSIDGEHASVDINDL